jgi:hypothetical protein
MEPPNYERNIANIVNWRCSSTVILVLDAVRASSSFANGHLEMHEGRD